MPRGRHRQVSPLTRISVYLAVLAPAVAAVVVAVLSGSALVLRVAVALAAASALAAMGVVWRMRTRHEDRLEDEELRRREDREQFVDRLDALRATEEDLRLKIEHQAAELVRMRGAHARAVAAAGAANRRPQELSEALFVRAAATLDALERRSAERSRAEAGGSARVKRPPVSSPDLVRAYAASMFGPQAAEPAKEPVVAAAPVARVAPAAPVESVAPVASELDTTSEALEPASAPGLPNVPAPDVEAVARMVQDHVAEVSRRVAGTGRGGFDFFTPRLPAADERTAPEPGLEPAAQTPVVAVPRLPEPEPDVVPVEGSATADDLADDLSAQAGPVVVPVAVVADDADVLEAEVAAAGPHEPVPVHGVPAQQVRVARPYRRPMPVDLTAHDDTEQLPKVRPEQLRKRA